MPAPDQELRFKRQVIRTYKNLDLTTAFSIDIPDAGEYYGVAFTWVTTSTGTGDTNTGFVAEQKTAGPGQTQSWTADPLRICRFSVLTEAGEDAAFAFPATAASGGAIVQNGTSDSGIAGANWMKSRLGDGALHIRLRWDITGLTGTPTSNITLVLERRR